MKGRFTAILVLAGLSIAFGACSKGYDPDRVDEAKAAGRKKEDYPTHPYDTFKDMDRGDLRERIAQRVQADPKETDKSPEHIEKLHQAAVKGRNTWLMWTAGNQAFWDYLARNSLGLVDFVKLLDNRQMERSRRLAKAGLISEPEMVAGDRPNRHGMWLDRPEWWPDPEWPPVDKDKFNAFRKTHPEVPDPYVYGYSSGIVGLRLYPNPAFDAAAEKRWAGRKNAGTREDEYLTNGKFYNDSKLVRPYRVGMACAFCHVSHDPTRPPAPGKASDPEWSNLSANIGSQYFKFGQVFAAQMKPTNLIWHLVNSAEPGSLDTSLLATDGTNNPNTMNAVFGLPARLQAALDAPREAVSEDTRAMGVLKGIGLPDNPRVTPHVLADGADSIGARGALCRVWLNIGEFHEEWIQLVNLMVGVREQRPFKIAKAQRDSVYFQVTDHRADNLARFFLEATPPKKLAEAPGGPAVLAKGAAQLPLGKKVFASHCFVCHSSKQPERFWKDPANWKKWLRDEAYLTEADQMVAKDDFLDNNYLSTDQRYKVTDIGVNFCRFVADNGKAGRVWEDFTSDVYKNQPVIEGEFQLAHPYEEGKTLPWSFSEDVGPGRCRPLSLISNWATAPFLHNNSVGEYPSGRDPADLEKPSEPDVSVAGRLETYDDSIRKLLGLKERLGRGSILRTDRVTRLELPTELVPDLIAMQLGIPNWLQFVILILLVIGSGVLALRGIRRLREQDGKPLGSLIMAGVGIVLLGVIVYFKYFSREVKLGHIPAGTPVNLIANLNGPGWLKNAERRKLLLKVIPDMIKVDAKKLPSLNHPSVPNLVDNLWKLNKCPDLIRDKGHTFGSEEVKDDDGTVLLRELTTAEREALIEFLKTM